jgi:hypothetical protein
MDDDTVLTVLLVGAAVYFAYLLTSSGGSNFGIPSASQGSNDWSDDGS